MEPVYTPVVGAAVSLFAVMGWDVTIEGHEHIPRHGPAVLASNHIGYLDFVVVGYGARPAGRLVRFAAKKEVFDHPVAGPLMRGMKHLPVDRDGDRNAVMDEAARRLERGQVVGMFPEGTISRSFMPADARTGTARMAMDAGAPLIPTALWGCQRLSTKAHPSITRRRGIDVSVSFGAPIDYDATEDARAVTDRLMARVREMVLDLQDGYAQRPDGEDERWWLPARLGGTAPTPEEADAMAAEERARRRERAAE